MRRNEAGGAAITRASPDPFGQRDNDPFGPADVGHVPDVLVLADAADQSVSVRSQTVDRRRRVGDLEANGAQTQLVRHRGGWMIATTPWKKLLRMSIPESDGEADARSREPRTSRMPPFVPKQSPDAPA
jgi:hypothetical protein